ncbi:MAG TPA: isocitrate/isopropylmalate family dehydrogenase, partial [Chryseosolibacter sp.]|nr:isocitrate/isopropylmalate family dehydrogenase [Chryseosolibacter sp.]
TAILKSAVMMLNHLGEDDLASRLDRAIDRTLHVREQCTADLGGKAGTREFTEFVIRNLEAERVTPTAVHR